MSAVASLLEQPLVYRLWQAPFQRAKLAPFLEATRGRMPRRVLDVACGPGTNTALFADSEYVGVDINPEYVRYASRRHPHRFEVANAAQELLPGEAPFDLVLLNSFLHHLATDEVHAVLRRVAQLLKPGGRVHILDLVLPETAGLPLLLARADRGPYARPLAEWRTLFESHFTTQAFAPYPLGVGPLTLWNMVYFRGGPR